MNPLGEVHFGDIVVSKSLMDKLSSEPSNKDADISVTRWDNIRNGKLYYVPYSFDYLPYRTVLSHYFAHMFFDICESKLATHNGLPKKG